MASTATCLLLTISTVCTAVWCRGINPITVCNGRSFNDTLSTVRKYLKYQPIHCNGHPVPDVVDKVTIWPPKKKPLVLKCGSLEAVWRVGTCLIRTTERGFRVSCVDPDPAVKATEWCKRGNDYDVLNGKLYLFKEALTGMGCFANRRPLLNIRCEVPGNQTCFIVFIGGQQSGNEDASGGCEGDIDPCRLKCFSGTVNTNFSTEHILPITSAHVTTGWRVQSQGVTLSEDSSETSPYLPSQATCQAKFGLWRGDLSWVVQVNASFHAPAVEDVRGLRLENYMKYRPSSNAPEKPQYRSVDLDSRIPACSGPRTTFRPELKFEFALIVLLVLVGGGLALWWFHLDILILWQRYRKRSAKLASGQQPQDTPKEYDVNIIYDESLERDTEFVVNDLRPLLADRWHQRVSIGALDAMSGSYLYESYVELLNASRLAVFVLPTYAFPSDALFFLLAVALKRHRSIVAIYRDELSRNRSPGQGQGQPGLEVLQEVLTKMHLALHMVKVVRWPAGKGKTWVRPRSHLLKLRLHVT